MPVYKYNTKKGVRWYAKINYTENGKYCQHWKRGFETRREATEYEALFTAAMKVTQATTSPTEALKAFIKASTETNITAATEALKASQKPAEEPQKQRTFQDVFEEYWATTDARGLTEGTRETKINMLTKHVLPYFGDYVLTEITPAMVQQWQSEIKAKERRGKPFSETYLHSIQSQFNAVLNYAVRKKYLPFSPMVDLKNMGEKNAPPRDFWTVEEYAKFAEYAQTRTETFAVFELCYWLGLRRGEALGIRPMDISYDERIGGYALHIAQSVDAKKRIGKTKTASSDRIIAIPDIIKTELDEYIAQQYDIQPTDRIFANVTVSHLQRDKDWAIKQSGQLYICTHGMRHSAASNFISSGQMTAADVAHWLGHATPFTTLRTYNHMLPTTQTVAADYIGDMRSKI